MSVVTLLVFLSATSAMVLAGPRVVASMAEDGALPPVFRQHDGHPPRAAAWLQASVALVLVWTQTLREAVQSTAVVLLLFTGLVALSAARLPSAARPARVAGAVYAAFAAFLLYKGVAMAPHVAWILAGAAVALATRLLLTRSSR
jgi:amino acid transporter